MSARHATEAAQWFLKLQDSDADPQTFLEWQRWMQADSGHRMAFALFEPKLRLKMGATRLIPTADEIAADDYDGSLPVAEWMARYKRTPQPPAAADGALRPVIENVAAARSVIRIAAAASVMRNA